MLSGELVSQQFRKARTVNQTSNGYVSKVPTGTAPSGTGSSATNASVIDAPTNSLAKPNRLVILPYAIGSNNNTFSVRVIGWMPTADSTTRIWIPVLLCELACTVSSSIPGVAAKDVLDTELFADTIAVTYGNANVSVEVVSPAADVVAHAIVNIKSLPKVELSFTTGGSATSCNSLVAIL
jgi:hypothetical protein